MERMHIAEKFDEPRFYSQGGQKLSRAVIEEIKLEIEDQAYFGRKQVY